MGERESIWIKRAESGPMGEAATARLVALRGFVGRARAVAIAAILGLACGPPADLSEAAKKQQVEDLYAGYEAEFEGVPGISAGELAARLESVDRPVVVDVRTPAEQAVSMIRGAVTREEFERRRAEFEGRAVVAYCTIGYRSGLYTEELRAAGWEAFNLEGSILSWTHHGGELVNGDEATRRLHVFGRQWDLAPTGYETVW